MDPIVRSVMNRLIDCLQQLTFFIQYFTVYTGKGFDFFECDVVETIGVPFPGEEDDLAPTLSCETDTDHEFGAVVFDLEGDTEEFFHGLDLSFGDVRIRVPVDVVGEHDVIKFDEVTSEQIAITYTGNERRNLASSDSTGEKDVLVIRVSNDNANCDPSNTQIPCSKVAQSAAKISDDIFGWNSNLVSIIEHDNVDYGFQSILFAHILITIVTNRKQYMRSAQTEN